MVKHRQTGMEMNTPARRKRADPPRPIDSLQNKAFEGQSVEKALPESPRILEVFFSSTLTPLAFLDKDFNFVRVNEAYAKACQRSVSEFVGHNHFEFYPHPENEAIFKKVVATKVPFQVQAKPFAFPDHPEWGETYWDWTLSPILDGSGQVEFLVFSLKDVTEETQAVQHLRQNEELLRKIMETLPVGVWIVDPEGRIIHGNRAGQEIWGGERLVGIDQYGEYKGWWVDTGQPIAPQEWASARAILKGETSLNEEIEIECFDGSRKVIFNSALPIRDEHGRITGAIILNQDITARRKGETARREQASLLDMAHDAIISRDIDGTIQFWNQGAANMYGWTKEEALGRKSHELLRTQFPEPLAEIDAKVIHSGRWEGELLHIHRDGLALTVSSRWALKMNAKGRPAGILEINSDVTERKKAEGSLRASSLYTRSLIEASLDPLVTISPEGKITDVNNATELVTGVPRRGLIGSDFSDYFTEPEKAREGYKEVFSRGAVKDYPLAIRHASGKVTDVLYNASVYKNEAGEVQGVFAAARDITERKTIEQERLKLASAVEQASESIAITDADGAISYVNPAFEAINGYPRQEALGKKYESLLETEMSENGMTGRLREAFRSGGQWSGHLRRRTRDGLSRELDVFVSPVRSPEGTILNYSIIERDVTQEIHLQNHLRQVQKMEALGTLAGGVAHDFNNILMTATINTELAQLSADEKNPVQRYLQLVLDAANRGKELVKQIIAFSRQKEQERSPIHIAPIIQEALKFLRSSLPQTIEFRENIKSVPDTILGDPTRIHQVLMNLCNNAAFAMRKDGGILSVSLTDVEVDASTASRNLDLKTGPYLRLTVSDTGEGIRPEVFPRIFDPFFTTKAQGEGAGMGLAVVHGIVKSHGGAIVAYSEPGQGSTFNVFLPQARNSAAEADRAAGPIPRGKERILLVDDEEAQAYGVRDMLETLGYKVTAITDSTEALAVFQKDPAAFDLVISDQTMPHMTGAKLAEHLLKIKPSLPIILCTGFSEFLGGEEAKSLGIREFVMKPYSAREIAEIIRRAMGPK